MGTFSDAGGISALATGNFSVDEGIGCGGGGLNAGILSSSPVKSISSGLTVTGREGFGRFEGTAACGAVGAVVESDLRFLMVSGLLVSIAFLAAAFALAGDWVGGFLGEATGFLALVRFIGRAGASSSKSSSFCVWKMCKRSVNHLTRTGLEGNFSNLKGNT